MANPTIKAGALLNPQNLPAADTLDGTERVPMLQSKSVGGSDGNTVDEPVVATMNEIATFGLPTDDIADATYTLSQGDALNWMNFTGTTVTLTIPEDDSEDIAIDSQFQGMFTGSGALTVAPESGSITVNSSGAMLEVDQYGVFGLKKYAANTWILYGTLA